MQGTNPTEFEKWCAKEMGHTVEYMIMQRKINTLGMLQYRNAEIEKRFMAYKAGLISGASIGCSHAKVQGTNWVKCSERVPEEPGRYLCYVEEVNSLGISHYQWNCSWNGVCFRDDSLSGRVTHWMPLPPPPMLEDE
ncbi:DUF551 domain-containing protein [Providencia stuartii]|uniref:DUF551 domain-containing protein n=1 Tax=Providencia stuartii TaxID=588 RepID=UPI0032128535